MRGTFDKPRPPSPKQPTHNALPPPIIDTAAALPPITGTRLSALSGGIGLIGQSERPLSESGA